MLHVALGWPRERGPDCSRTLVAQGGAVWIWPGIPLTLRHGGEILPVASEAIHFWITRLHGPDALYKDLPRAIEAAAQHLKAGDETAAQYWLDALRLTELSHDDAALMRAVADHLDVAALNLPLRVTSRTWNAQDIALHLPISKRQYDAARALVKAVTPVFNPEADSGFDPEKHPRWPAGAPDSQGGEFAPTDGSGAAIIPVASRSGKPPKASAPQNAKKPKAPSPPDSDLPRIRFLKPGELPDWPVDNIPLPPPRPADLDAPPDPPPASLEPGSDDLSPDFLGPDDLLPGIGHNSGDPTPLDDVPGASSAGNASVPVAEPAPAIPQQPISNAARNLFVKAAVRWIARKLPLLAAPELGLFLIGLQASYWVGKAAWPYIKSYFDPPKTLQELQADALKPETGYDIHHFVEKGQARADGIPESVWDAPENRVRIPTLKHWQITGWYMTPNDKYGGMSPRAYLKGKSWEERIRVGKSALIKFGVLRK
ncbi:MAG: hypothetical protein EPN75_07910 [Beijerinckiaceae bacterium]|nr:MAG: hypothetical protein EPN75_07910 [Beijerinckiaceae bacterium]